MTTPDIYPRETLAERAKVMLSRGGCVGVSILGARTVSVPFTEGIDVAAAILTCADILRVKISMNGIDARTTIVTFQRPGE